MKTLEKFYWRIMPDSYHIMNKSIGSNYTDSAIELFKLNYKNGLLVFFEKDVFSPKEFKTSHIAYEKIIGSGFERLLNEFKFMGELSRKSKLKKLNENR